MHQLRHGVFEEIKEKATPDKAEWWNQYMKGEIPFLGVGTPDIREVFLNRDRESAFEDLAMNDLTQFGFATMLGSFSRTSTSIVSASEGFMVFNERLKLCQPKPSKAKSIPPGASCFIFSTKFSWR